ncbi:MAG: hypothetical protein HYU66_02000, partial [Armatimonadetes bacterium]|nr:hypothetical protein [Armatimonadota bacterium]
MRDSRQRRMVCTDETPAPLTAGLALARCSTVLFLLVGLFPFWIDWLPDPDLCAPVWLLMLAADLWFGARVWGGQSKRWCIRMDRRGLTEVWRLVGWKHYPWDSVQSVDLRSQSAVVHTWLGDIDIGPEVEGGRALAVLVKLRLDQGVRAEVPTTVDHERVAKWLGVAPGEVVSAKIRDESVDAVTRVGCLTGVPLSVILICLLSGEPQPVFWLFVLACVVGVARAARRCPRRIDATAERLRVHCLLGRYDLAWSDLLSIRHNP